MSILDIPTFGALGGHTGTASAYAIEAAISIAERQMEKHLLSYLQPTIVTGLYYWHNDMAPIELEMGNLIRVEGAWLYYPYQLNSGTYEVKGVAVYVRSAHFGYLDVPACPSPYQIEIATQSGLQTGVSMTDKGLLLALTLAAGLVLNEIVAPGTDETEVGIQRFSSLRYSEERYKLGTNIFGSSKTAQYISKLVEHLRVRRIGRF